MKCSDIGRSRRFLSIIKSGSSTGHYESSVRCRALLSLSLSALRSVRTGGGARGLGSGP